MRMFGQFCRNETNPTITDSEDVQIAVALKHSNSIWRTLEMILINCEINVILP